MRSEQSPIRCPECDSERTWKDGLRKTSTDAIQRYLCRRCGFRFSDSAAKLQIQVDISGKLFEMPNPGNNYVQCPTPGADLAIKKLLDETSLFSGEDVGSQDLSSKTSATEPSNTLRFYNSKRRVCAEENEAKNLAEVETQEGLAQREGTEKAQKNKGEIVSFAWHMQKKGLSKATIKNRVYRLGVLVKRGADLEDPETVETILATSEWHPANKRGFINSYAAFAKYINIEWEKPKVVVPNKEPFLPQEEVQQLIAGCGKKTSTLLQLLFETGVRIGEAALLEWTDVDFKAKQVRVNCPEKGGNARTLKLSDLAIAMLKALTKRKDGHLFNPRVMTLQSTFAKARNRLSRQLQNPRLREIHFHTLRHLKATTEYYRTGGDILRVKYVLGHKRLDTTGRYAHYQAFRSEEYIVKRPRTKDEEDQLIQDGFTFVRFDERYDEAIYRKRK